MRRPTHTPAVRVLATGAALPGRDVPGAVLTNERLAELHRQAAERLRESGIEREVPPCSASFPEERVGVQERRILDADADVAQLASVAAENALQRAGTTRARRANDLRVVVVATVSALEPAPAVATVVAGRVGASSSTLAFDLGVGCSGFTAALECVRSLLARHPAGTLGLVVGAEAMSRVLDATDRTTAPIFGDGAGALLVERTDAEAGLCAVETTTLPECGERIRIASLPAERGPMLRLSAVRGEPVLRVDERSRLAVAMEGRRVFRDMTRTLPPLVRELLERQSIELAAVDRVVFHQANERLISAVAASLDLSPERRPSNIARYGNTTSASIPLLLSEAEDERALHSGQRLLLVGFGTGYCVGITTLTWT